MDGYYFLHKEYAARTGHLSCTEDLALRKIIDLCILEDWNVKYSVSAVSRKIGMEDHKEEVKVILEEFFQEDANGMINSEFTERVVSLNEPR